ncbi:MAG: DUF2284 domain-containing protein [Lachnospiraceae bacterium]
MDYERYIEWLLQKGADMAKVVDADTVATAAWVVYKCKFSCSAYGTNRCCPPYAPTYQETQEMLKDYSKGILFRTHDIDTVTPLAVGLEKELFLDGYYKALAFGAGSCSRCKKCNIERCNFTRTTVPSMEACGIDVFATVRANGLEIHTLREEGECQNCFGLVLIA